MTIDQITENEDDLFERGDEEVERGSGYRERPWWWLKEEGDTAILRFLEESADWRKVPTHRFFPTKPEPEGHEGKWPDQMPAICRAGRLAGRFPQGCAIDSSGYEGPFSKKGSKSEDVRYTIAVEREEYKDDNGRRRYRDKEIEVPVFDHGTGEVSETETITLPSLVLVGEPMWRMMSAVKATGEMLGSLRTRDMRLRLMKNPSGNKGLIVQPISLDPDKDNPLQPGTKSWEVYEYAQQIWKPGGLSLGREIFYRASDEWWNRFFLMPDGRTWKQHDIEQGGDKTRPRSQGSSSSSSSSSSSRTADKPDPDKLAQMYARILPGS